MASHTVGFISQRAENILSIPFGLKDIFDKVASNPYDEENKNGIINLCTAHNESVTNIITEKLNQQDLKWDSSMMPYPLHCEGLLCLRKAVADFLTNHIGAPEPLDPEKMCIMCGVTSLLSVLAFTLCDPGDTILTPSPMYGGIPRDIMYQCGVKTYPVYLSSKAEPDGRDPFELTVPLLESALENAKKEGHKVKALILVNPYNPCATVYTKEQVMQYLTFCNKHDLHCVVDEIYNASIFDNTVENSSVFTFRPDDLPNKNKTHILWGMAKDFGMPGSPVGVVYTWSPVVFSVLVGVVDFYQVPLYIQMAVTKLLEDKDWLQKSYLPNHDRMLIESSNIMRETLDELDVPYVKPTSGLFVWADFRKFIRNATKESEMSFAVHCLDNGVAIAPGGAFYYNEYGWARLVHAVPKSTLIEAMKRLKVACKSFQG